MRLRFNFAEKEELDQIHEATLDVLKNVGVNFHEKEALDIFKAHGARVDGNTVFIEADMVTKALSTAPSKFEWKSQSCTKAVTCWMPGTPMLWSRWRSQEIFAEITRWQQP